MKNMEITIWTFQRIRRVYEKHGNNYIDTSKDKKIL